MHKWRLEIHPQLTDDDKSFPGARDGDVDLMFIGDNAEVPSSPPDCDASGPRRRLNRLDIHWTYSRQNDIVPFRAYTVQSTVTPSGEFTNYWRERAKLKSLGNESSQRDSVAEPLLKE